MLNTENRYLFKFAWKSIRRNAGRSFFIGFSVSLAVIIAVWVVAFFDGLNSQIEKAVVNTNTGFFQVQEPVYSRSTDSSSPVEFSSQLAQNYRVIPLNHYHQNWFLMEISQLLKERLDYLFLELILSFILLSCLLHGSW
jgi:hypothetical protein